MKNYNILLGGTSLIISTISYAGNSSSYTGGSYSYSGGKSGSSSSSSLMVDDGGAALKSNGEGAASISDMFTKAKITGDIRARYEFADQDGREEANAGTLRARLGILSGKYAGFQAFGEYEGTITADRDSYQAASIHGLGQNRTIIADPESHDLNRAWISWTGADTAIKVGRQRIILNNARHVGNVGWRQNEQTFDAVTLKQGFGPVNLHYGYFNEVNRIFGSEEPALAGQQDFSGDSHYLHGTLKTGFGATIGAYGYMFELENGAGSANNINSYGAYISGSTPLGATKLNYYGEYAHQTDGSGSPLDYATNYFHVKSDVNFQGYQVGIGYENLGSDNGVGYKFPLGTNHKFNGFADKFLGTPADGLQDLYIYGSKKLPGGFLLKLAYHQFGSDGGSFEYGQEIDAVLVKKFSKSLKGIAKFAYYEADEFASDTTKFSVEMNYKF